MSEKHVYLYQCNSVTNQCVSSKCLDFGNKVSYNVNISWVKMWPTWTFTCNCSISWAAWKTLNQTQSENSRTCFVVNYKLYLKIYPDNLTFDFMHTSCLVMSDSVAAWCGQSEFQEKEQCWIILFPVRFDACAGLILTPASCQHWFVTWAVLSRGCVPPVFLFLPHSVSWRTTNHHVDVSA